MSERTADGYVFRTDLRLRPDPGATPIAIPLEAALSYYESMGQNWERAAYIKARPVAGDIEAGEQFLKELAPFVWRKYFDFAAIADVHSIKRQIHAHKGHGEIAVARPQHQTRTRRHSRNRIFRADAAAHHRRPRSAPARARDARRCSTSSSTSGWVAAEARDDLRRRLSLSCATSSIAFRWSPTSRSIRCREAEDGVAVIG